MLEKFIYTNSLNESLEFGKDCLFVNENDLRDFAWNITSKNDKISGFKKGIVKKTIPIVLKCETEDEGLYLRNRLFEVFEKDVLTKQYGKIHIGEYYLKCFITGIKKTQYLINMNHMVITATVQTDAPEWIRESTSFYEINTDDVGDQLDYPYDFSHDFGNSFASRQITNSALVASNFIINIFLNKILYKVSNPKADDVIVFLPNGNEKSHYYVRRVIGIPGDRVQIKDGAVYINGELYNEKIEVAAMEETGIAGDEIVLGEDEYFVLGDNRNGSSDSRDPSVGILKREEIIGRAWVRIWPLNNLGVISHE
mgnify:CR=1 FL=1